MSIKLNQANLRRISPEVRAPAYDLDGRPQSIVHIGVGGFHRAHQAVYLDDLLHNPGNSEWSICGVGLLEQDARMRDALLPQDCLYTVMECDAGGEKARVIGALRNYLFAPADPQAAIEKMASPECRIVSLTITEGGYYINQGTGEFDDGHPDILHDLSRPHQPRCVFGYLAEALDRRRRRGLPPFTVLSCDNLQQNGSITRKVMLSFAERRDPALNDWLAANGAFPNSMVDRITPMTADRHRIMLKERFCLDDAWPVVTEPFKQWVIEDAFAAGRPAWEHAGAQLTTDVSPYEKMKIRLLNAGHQAICHAGRLMGYEFVHEAAADPLIRNFLLRMMDLEITPLIPDVPGVDLEDYKKTLVARFGNPAIRDPLSRIGMEGSARMPEFVLPSIAEQLESGGPIRMLSFAVACWFRCLNEKSDEGREMPIVDPMADRLRECVRRGGPDPRPLLGLRELFGDALPSSRRFLDELVPAMRSLYERGARAALAGLVGPPGR